jgi:hypothetical protein
MLCRASRAASASSRTAPSSAPSAQDVVAGLTQHRGKNRLDPIRPLPPESGYERSSFRSQGNGRRGAQACAHPSPLRPLRCHRRLDPETGFPFASRVLLGTDIDGVPVILVSGLSAHTRALDADVSGIAADGRTRQGRPAGLCPADDTVPGRTGRARQRGPRPNRGRFLNRHAKAKLYIDFPDFRFSVLCRNRRQHQRRLRTGLCSGGCRPGDSVACQRDGSEPGRRDSARSARQEPRPRTRQPLALKGADHKIWGICWFGLRWF